MEFFNIASEQDMEALGRSIAQFYAARGGLRGRAFLLNGPLGAGKSVLARGFIRAFSGAQEDEDIPSPTFTLVQYYETRLGPLYHFDLYRLTSPDDVFELGWEEALSDGITLIEWPEKAGLNIPQKAIAIDITITGETTRRVSVQDPMQKIALIQEGFILAAGKGTRLRPHTDHKPKPMVNVAGESIIKRSIKKIHQAGVQKIVVNVHHLGGLLKEHLKDINAPQIICSDEEELLETGGGIKKALSHFSGPFFIINGDALWEDGPVPALSRLAEAWDEIRMDILLLLQPKSAMPLTQGAGDYRMLADGQARRAHDKNGDYMFAGIRIAHPRIFDGSPDTAFSFLTLMDKAEREGRLFALVHDGAWHHISAPEDLAAVNRHFEGTAL